jgi:hypothetical protein
MDSKRIQLTLFVPESISATIEEIRCRYNPVQHNLIAAHVTLCREDELTSLEAILKNLDQLIFPAFAISFNSPVRFDNGKGLLLPAIDNTTFQELRKLVLKSVVDQPRIHAPHLTLMHPRNSTCTDLICEEIQSIPLPESFHFDQISLIEQVNGAAWTIKNVWTLGSGTANS